MLTDRIDAAFSMARELHQAQTRKATPVPYLAHLLAVCSLVLEQGGDEEEAIAALLHDAVEDQGGMARLDAIRREFGPRVADIVMECSDAFSTPKPPWRERKEQFLRRVPALSRSALKVTGADKLHNLRSLAADLQRHGERIWEQFKGGRDGTLWYFESFLAAYTAASGDRSIADELSRLLAALKSA